ncbi:MAG: aspartyl protease family protein [Saprospiraceae bacterium]
MIFFTCKGEALANLNLNTSSISQTVASGSRSIATELSCLSSTTNSEAFSVEKNLCTSLKPSSTLKIPFRYINGFLIVDVLVNERLPLSFIFDTGSKHTILTDENFIPFLGQLPEEEIQIVGSDLSIPITGHIMRRTSLSVGEVDLENQSLILLDGGILDLNVLTGEDIHGILGIGAFGAYAVKINYQTGTIELFEAESFRPSKKAITVPIRVEKSKAYVDIEAEIHPGKTQQLSLLLDSGASLSMLIHVAQADSTLFPPRLVTGTFGYGLGGYLEGYVGRSDFVHVGPIDLPGIITHFQVLSDVNTLADIPTREGIIGNGILDRFTVIIDFPSKELHLVPIRHRQRRAKYDRSGLRLVRDGAKLDELRVQHIVKGSPADLAGISVGDELLKVGIYPIKMKSLSGIESMLRGKVGRSVRLLMRSDAVETQKIITLKELI